MELEQKTEVTTEEANDFPDITDDDPDLPPEYCHYQDDGCEFADSCLNCPFPKCIYEQPGGKRHWLKRLRNREMARLASSEGKGVKELALRFGVSQRTVQRALKNSPPLLSPSKGKIKKRGTTILKHRVAEVARQGED